MNSRGFLPLTTTGIVLLVLSFILVSHLAWENHERKMLNTELRELEELNWKLSLVHALLRERLRWVAEQSLLEASQNANSHHPNVEDFAGALASEYFMEELREMANSLRDNHIIIRPPSVPPLVTFTRVSDFVLAQVYFPSGLPVEIRSCDNLMSSRSTVQRVEAPIKVRFFLLENLMDRFVKEHRAEISSILEKAFYSEMWSEALILGTVRLDRRIDEMLFRLAWCKTEDKIFGSAGSSFDILGESWYEVFPPKPERSPFVSVYHRLEVESIKYEREDPAGMAGSQTATPVYIPFLHTILWWGQVNISIELKGGVEEIFDYPHQIILQETLCGPVHSCLHYRWALSEENFNVRVIILSSKPFSFSEA